MTAAAFETLTLSWVTEGVALVTLDRPSAANTINTAMTHDLFNVVDAVQYTAEAKVLVITGSGRHFCAGADLRETDRPATWLVLLRRAVEALAASELITIAAINGSCLGGGLELALACDLRIAAADARVGTPEIKFGMLPAAGGPQRLARLIGPAATKRLVLTGAELTGAEAQQLGIVDESTALTEVVARALALAESIAVAPRYALRTAKFAIDRGLDTALAPALATEYRAIDKMATPAEREIETRKSMDRSATYQKIFSTERPMDENEVR